MNLYSVEVTLYATAYVRAADEQEAVAKAGQISGEPVMFGGPFEDAPDISLSPAMTLYEVDHRCVSLVDGD
jgi:hypothetical protein